jgi:hypothetical protein
LIPYFAITLFAGVRPGLNGELAKLAEHPELVSLEKQVDSNNGGYLHTDRYTDHESRC